MKLDIVVPAYNEEASIASTIQRCLNSRADIRKNTHLCTVTVTVVSDGSTDKTLELAKGFEPDVRVIAHERNRGYGAAIKTGFAAGNGELVAFLDADGTCDPRFFALLVNELLKRNASVAVGSRMNVHSKMPAIRRLGNRVWRTIINWMAQTNITDAASGMRVIRRDALPLLEPLPDGMHYTPTMSCRSALDARLLAVEVPMNYAERIGKSKLSVARDGLRFLRTILDVGLTYQPFRLIGLPGFLLLLLFSLLLFPMAIEYVRFHAIEEGYVYRILAVIVLGTVGFQMLLAGLAGERAVGLVHPKKWSGGPFLKWSMQAVTSKRLVFLGLILFAIALALNAGGLTSRLLTGHVQQHWSRAALGGLLVLVGFQCIAAALLDRTLLLLAADRTREFMRPDCFAPETTPDA